MVAADNIAPSEWSLNFPSQPPELMRLLQGEILLQTRPYSAFGGAVTAWMYLPIARSLLWTQLTNYARWVHYFPNIVCSEILESNPHKPHRGHRLHQAAHKHFLIFSAQVDIHLRVFENLQRQIRFRMERGSFKDFSAQLTLNDCGDGTVLTYAVEATPIIPVPSILIEQAIRQDLPANLQQMRQVICTERDEA